MVRRACILLSLFALLSAAFPLNQGTAHGGPGRDVSITCSTNNQATFQAIGIKVTVCPSTVSSGQPVSFIVHTLRLATVNIALAYPDSSSSTASATADGKGVAALEIQVQYNPLNRYAQAQFTASATKLNHTIQVAGTITIAQTSPLSAIRLQARPRYVPPAQWCPNVSSACVIRNKSTVVIRVQSTAGAQVSVNLLYPDGNAISCIGNDLTSSGFAGNNGLYRCELPVFYQANAIGNGAKIQIVAQVSAGGITESRTLTMYLVTR